MGEDDAGQEPQPEYGATVGGAEGGPPGLGDFGGTTAAGAIAGPAAVDPSLQGWLSAVLELVHAVDHAWHSVATHARMSLNELIALELLYFSGHVSSPSLRRRTGLSASSITGLIDRLEQRGLVRRVRPPDNRRVVLIELTDLGRDHAASLFKPLLASLAQASPTPAPPIAEQLPTITYLAEVFERIAISPDADLA